MPPGAPAGGRTVAVRARASIKEAVLRVNASRLELRAPGNRRGEIVIRLFWGGSGVGGEATAQIARANR